MNNRTFSLVAATLASLASPLSVAHTSHSHDASAPNYVAEQVVATRFGQQGDPQKVSRTITVEMTDNMRFTPARITASRGETVRLNITNKGKLLHELVLGTPEEIQKHWEAMKRYPGMQHEEAHMVHVAPGKRKDLVWQFTKVGEFEFACLLPGHFEAGMVGKVVVR